MRMRRIFYVAVILLAAACGVRKEQPRPDPGPPVSATFEKFVLRAEAGDADAQNLIGYMLYFGEGVARDRQAAYFWFRKAANQGHSVGQLNVASIRYLDDDSLPARQEAGALYADFIESQDDGAWPSDVGKALRQVRERHEITNIEGQNVYETYCAGCHGLNGISRFVGSPSFAIGERLDKNDIALKQTIRYGHNVMPGWQGQLSDRQIADVLVYIRAFEQRFRHGIAAGIRPTPRLYFTFGPMSGQELGVLE